MKSKKNKGGRPPLPRSERLGRVYGVRLRQDEEILVVGAIHRSGLSQPDWLRKVIVEAARRG